MPRMCHKAVPFAPLGTALAAVEATTDGYRETEDRRLKEEKEGGRQRGADDRGGSVGGREAAGDWAMAWGVGLTALKYCALGRATGKTGAPEPGVEFGHNLLPFLGETCYNSLTLARACQPIGCGVCGGL